MAAEEVEAGAGGRRWSGVPECPRLRKAPAATQHRRSLAAVVRVSVKSGPIKADTASRLAVSNLDADHGCRPAHRGARFGLRSLTYLPTESLAGSGRWTEGNACVF